MSQSDRKRRKHAGPGAPAPRMKLLSRSKSTEFRRAAQLLREAHVKGRPKFRKSIDASAS